MDKYLVIAPSYPSENEKYSSTFVHTRVKEYIKRGLKVDVLVLSNSNYEYEFEGVKVNKLTIKNARLFVQNEKYKKILCHFGFYKQISLALNYSEAPVIIWFHGVDIISWRRRLYNFIPKRFIKFGAYIIINTLRRIYLNYVRKNYSNRVTFVFVSEWLKKVAEKDIFSTNKIKSFEIIPNPIDTNIFSYNEKKIDDRLKFLTIKSFDSRNYANDIVQDVIVELSKKEYFDKLSFTIVGKGRLWNKNTNNLKKFDNVRLINEFKNHIEIKKLHDKNGVIFMPSRQDTHGISTCEGMSSGLVAISSNNSAIPEFVSDKYNYLGKTVTDFVEIIEKIYLDDENYINNSKKSSLETNEKCGIDVVIRKEINLLKK